MNLKHWLKIDHLAFLLILPPLLIGLKYMAVLFWSIALFYDIYEQWRKHE